MKERIKAIRKALGLSGENFGKRIGLKKVAISQVETGRTNPTEQTIVSICREFNVSEDWLRNGEGDMFIPITIDEEIETFIGSVQADINNAFKKRFISALAKLSTEEWKAIEHLIKNMINEREQ